MSLIIAYFMRYFLEADLEDAELVRGIGPFYIGVSEVALEFSELTLFRLGSIWYIFMYNEG